MRKEKEETQKEVTTKEAEKQSLFTIRLSVSDCEKMGVSGETNKEVEKSFRIEYSLPERKKQTKKSELVTRLGLKSGATQKEINSAMLQEMEVRKINLAAKE